MKFFNQPPHVLPYQGSKRKLAKDIVKFFPATVETLFEPFAGSAAITLAAAANNLANKFTISDRLEPLAELWKRIISDPDHVAKEYKEIWDAQHTDPDQHYLKIRKEFNCDKDSTKLLFLIARCVKNSIRFNSQGDFNQGADRRRRGTRPTTLTANIKQASMLLMGRTEVFAADYKSVIAQATPNDLVYMDPPWQGTSGKRDPRYAYLLDLAPFLEDLDTLNSRGVPFILSFDGTCGDRQYGIELPSELKLTRIELAAGRSSQATLLGRTEHTVESLYLSEGLLEKNGSATRRPPSKQISFL